MRRATFISPYDGVVPPSGMPAHNSTRSAPPSCAARQLSTPLAHTSNLKLVVFIIFYCLRVNYKASGQPLYQASSRAACLFLFMPCPATAPLCLVCFRIGNAGVVYSLQAFYKHQFCECQVAEGDRTFAEVSIAHVAIDNLVHQCRYALLRIFGQ